MNLIVENFDVTGGIIVKSMPVHWSRIEYDGTVGQDQNSQEMSQLCSTVFKYSKCHMKCHNCTLCSLSGWH